ncbi:MAG: hypothetical protein R3336_07135, partial [Phycisphaeraceae bacterium]|nr:hypothetical protein [Phycisphaeraceae bacterium]
MSTPDETPLADHAAIAAAVDRAVSDQPVTDMHTHCYAPAFGASPDPDGLLLWGIDELVTYHYLVAEVFRVVPPWELAYEDFWAMDKSARADHIWQHLFVERTPISEAGRGVVTTLTKLGLDPNETSLEPYRQWSKEQDPGVHVDRVMELAGVDQIVMTNEVFTDAERERWLADDSIADDPRFAPVLR